MRREGIHLVLIQDGAPSHAAADNRADLRERGVISTAALSRWKNKGIITRINNKRRIVAIIGAGVPTAAGGKEG